MARDLQRPGSAASTHQSASKAPMRLAIAEINGHDDDRHDGEGRRERNVAGRALLRVDGLADEMAAKCRRSAG